MRKLYTMALALAALCLPASAANVKMYAHGVEIEPDTRIDLADYIEEDNPMYDIYFNPELTMVTQSSGNLKVTCNFTKHEFGPEGVTGDVQFCSIDGTCVGLSLASYTYTKSGGFVTKGAEFNMETELIVDFGKYDESEVTYDAEFNLTVELGNETQVYYFYATKTDAAVKGILDDSDAPVSYYDLQGRQVANPESGIYIKRQGSKATKVIL